MNDTILARKDNDTHHILAVQRKSKFGINYFMVQFDDKDSWTTNYKSKDDLLQGFSIYAKN